MQSPDDCRTFAMRFIPENRFFRFTVQFPNVFTTLMHCKPFAFAFRSYDGKRRARRKTSVVRVVSENWLQTV